MAAKKTEPGFEEAMLRLEEIARRLEKGDASLEESMKLFEEGTHLVSLCDRLLNEAETKVVLLSRGENGAPVETELRVGE